MTKNNHNIEIIKYKNNLLLKSIFDKQVNFKRVNVESSILNIDSLTNNILVNSERSKQYKKKIFLKGLGYKVILENKKLMFKLNYSHTIEIQVPSYITKITINKTNLVFESTDSVLLGSFLETIYNLKPKDNYKGKGFSLISKVVPLKEIKKK